MIFLLLTIFPTVASTMDNSGTGEKPTSKFQQWLEEHEAKRLPEKEKKAEEKRQKILHDKRVKYHARKYEDNTMPRGDDDEDAEDVAIVEIGKLDAEGNERLKLVAAQRKSYAIRRQEAQNKLIERQDKIDAEGEKDIEKLEKEAARQEKRELERREGLFLVLERRGRRGPAPEPTGTPRSRAHKTSEYNS